MWVDCSNEVPSGIIIARVHHDGHLVGLGDGHEHDLIPPLSWLGHPVQVLVSREVTITLCSKGMQDVHVGLEPGNGIGPDSQVPGLLAKEVEGHGPEHAVAIPLNDVADLEAVQALEDGSHPVDALHLPEAGLLHNRLGGREPVLGGWTGRGSRLLSSNREALWVRLGLG